jgi:MerR family transcriptional regulator, light-induced transcriptional regulator
LKVYIFGMDDFSIRAVALRTGLSPYVIRAWELRYAAVTPYRTPTGHRRYTQEQVTKLEWLRRAQADGHSIGTLAALPLEDIMGLVGEERHAGSPLIMDALDALKALDPERIDQEFGRALKVLGRLELIDGFIFPFILGIHKAVEKGTLRSAHLSFAHARLREFLAILASSVAVPGDAPRLVLSSAFGLEHEPGLLGSAIHAAAAGWRTIRLSPGTPVEELAFAAVENGARAVVYSIIGSGQASGAIAEAVMLRRLVSPSTVIMFGGRLDPASSEALIGAGLERIPDMDGLRARLEALAQREQPIAGPDRN